MEGNLIWRFLLSLALGIGVTLILGLWRRTLLRSVYRPLRPPEGVDGEKWKRATRFLAPPPSSYDEEREEARAGEGRYGLAHPGELLGRFERLVFFGLLWVGGGIILLGWLVFKAASSWQVWRGAAELPPDLEAEKLDLWRARQEYGRLMLNGVLLDTMYNLFCALVGFGVSMIVLGQGLLSLGLSFGGR